MWQPLNPPIAVFTFEQDVSESWFRFVGTPSLKSDIQMELYRVTGMIQLVQLAAGSGWSPELIELRMPENKIVQASRLISRSKIVHSKAASGFPVPNNLLQLPVAFKIPETKQPALHYEINTDFVTFIRQLIGVFVNHKDCNIDEVCRVTEIPKRSLQRRLRSHGTSFYKLLSEAKFDLAKDNLKNSDLTIAEISFQLGYSDPAHFSNAFRRWAGMSPSQFRESILKQS